jgi:hypothetical protein
MFAPSMPGKTTRPLIPLAFPRTRLFNQLDSAERQHAVSLISGPHGAGKTTLISSYVDHRKVPCLWYRVDPGDQEISRFFQCFGEAAKATFANGASLQVSWPGPSAGLTGYSRQFFRGFYSRVRKPFIWVLDDYQGLADDSALQDVIRAACEEAPPNCQIVIATREYRPRPFAPTVLRGALAFIDADELTLTPEETGGIAELHGIKLPSVAATTALHKRCAGWALGLKLELDRLLSAQNDEARDGDAQPFDDCSAQQINKLESECCEFLLTIASLPERSIRDIAQLADAPGAPALLRELIRMTRHVTGHTDGGGLLLNPLSRRVLAKSGPPDPLPDLTAHYSQAAEAHLSKGDCDAALELLVRAKNWARIVEMLMSIAPTLKEQGRHKALDLWLEKLPPDLLATKPWLLYWHGSSKLISEPCSGHVILEKAYVKFRELGEISGMALSWAGVLDAIFFVRKDFRQIDRWIDEFEERISGQIESLSAATRFRITLAFFRALSFRHPVHPEISFWLEQVRKLLDTTTGAQDRSITREHLVTFHILRGEHAEAESVLSMQRDTHDVPLIERPLRTLFDHLSEATVAMHAGMDERCLRAVSHGLRAAKRSENYAAAAIFLQIGAAMSQNRGDPARTDEFLAAFERLAEKLPLVDPGGYYAVAAWRKFSAGENAFALRLLRHAVTASEARGTEYYIATDRLGLGLLLHLCGETGEALTHLEAGRKVGAAIKNKLIEFVFQLFSAYIAAGLGEQATARDHLVIAMRLGRKYGYMHFIFFPQAVVARLCLLALESGIEPDYVRALIERNKLRPDPTWRHAECWPWPVRIYTLGRFGIVKQGVALRFTGKAQKKPLELLKALIAFGGREVPEAKLADALWPEAEGDAGSQALTTTLFRLRKLVGEQVIRRQDARLSLDSAFCWVDCWAFERLLNDTSVDALMRFERLKRLHQGPFLEGADDVPWAQPLRQRLLASWAKFKDGAAFVLFLCQTAMLALVECFD